MEENPQIESQNKDFFIITVIPITKGVFRDSLSYYSAEKMATGNIVAVPLRGREIKALVISCESASKIISIKSREF